MDAFPGDHLVQPVAYTLDNRHRRSTDLDKTAHSKRRIGLHPADIIKSSSRPMGANGIKPFFPSDIQWVEPPTDRQTGNKIIQRTFRIFFKSPAVVGLQDHQEVHILVGYADRRMEILSSGRGLKPLGSSTFRSLLSSLCMGQI